MENKIYLDANAGARLRPSTKAALEQCFQIKNPSSIHFAGRAARSLIREARRTVLRFLGLKSGSSEQKLVFTSGGTEACNTLVFGFLGPRERLAMQKGHIVSSAIEHPAIREPLLQLVDLGWEVDFIAPDSSGRVRVEDFVAKVRPDTALVNLMSVNNESGAIQPIIEVAQTLRSRGYQGPLVSDFVQALGKTSLRAGDLFLAGVDAIAISSHKIGAPSGTGAVIIQQGSNSACRIFSPFQLGGVQEEGFRPGTENVFGIVAFAAACEEAQLEGETLQGRLKDLRELLWDGLKDLPGATRYGPQVEEFRTCNTLMLAFSGLRADDLVVAFDVHGVMCSTGSACISGKQGVSHVPRAMGLTEEKAREVLRMSLDWCTSEAEIQGAISIVRQIILNAKSQEVSQKVDPMANQTSSFA